MGSQADSPAGSGGQCRCHRSEAASAMARPAPDPPPPHSAAPLAPFPPCPALPGCCRFQQGLTCEYVPLPVGSKQMVDDMWPLYKK